MTSLDGFLRILDARSFASLWYWLVLVGVWSLCTRNVLGVPVDVVRRATKARMDPDAGDDGLLLLDWLSLVLPRWRLSAAEAATLMAIAAFGLSSLAVLGFGYGGEFAQALVLLLAPLGLVALLRLRLARRLTPLLTAAQQARMPAAEASLQAGRMMTRHRRFVTFLSLVAVAVAAIWGTIWGLLHPFGL